MEPDAPWSPAPRAQELEPRLCNWWSRFKDAITAARYSAEGAGCFPGVVPGTEVNWALRNNQQTIAVVVSQCRPC